MSFKKVLLIKPQLTKASAFFLDTIPCGLEYIAAYIQNHVEKVDILDLATDSNNLEYHLKKLKPDFVGISITNSTEHNESLHIAKKAKQYGALVVVGGYHATGLAEVLAAHSDIDFVVRGEGEETMLELIQKGSAEEVRGISYSKDGKIIHNPDRPLISDLDSIPYPARSLRKYKYTAPFFGIKEYDAITTSRGCWGRCKFCCEPMMCQGIQRYRKPKEIIKELEEILRLHKGREILILINDPNFGGNPKITEELCDRLIEFRIKNKFEIRFPALCRVDLIGNNEELVKKMIKAGIDFITLGIETPNKKHLGLMSKNTTKELQEKAVKNFRDNGGTIYGPFVVGLPYQTEKDIQECIDYAKHLKIDFPLLMMATPFPGSELYKELKSKNLIIEKDWDKYFYTNLVFKHDSFTEKQLRGIVLRSTLSFYNDLMIKREYREFILKNRKKKLYSFAVMLMSTVNFVRSSFKKEDISIDNLKEYINPDLKIFTEEKGLHNIFEMARFLKILGNQKIQITTNIDNKPVISWIIKTTRNNVKYIDSTFDIINDASVVINLSAEDTLLSNNYRNLNLFDIRKVIKVLIKDNKGFKAKYNLIKLFAAVGVEILVYNIDTIRNKNVI